MKSKCLAASLYRSRQQGEPFFPSSPPLSEAEKGWLPTATHSSTGRSINVPAVAKSVRESCRKSLLEWHLQWSRRLRTRSSMFLHFLRNTEIPLMSVTVDKPTADRDAGT